MISKSCVLVLCCVMVAVLAGEKYTDKYDNFNIQELLDNQRLLLAYCDCILDRGSCTPEGKELKLHIQDALETGCEKCTDKQKEKGKILFNHVIEHERGIWNEMTAKFDPKGIWRKKYEERAKKEGINIPQD